MIRIHTAVVGALRSKREQIIGDLVQESQPECFEKLPMAKRAWNGPFLSPLSDSLSGRRIS